MGHDEFVQDGAPSNAMRWGLCLSLVLSLHVVAVLALRHRHPPEIPMLPADSVVVDLMPPPAAVATSMVTQPAQPPTVSPPVTTQPPPMAQPPAPAKTERLKPARRHPETAHAVPHVTTPDLPAEPAPSAPSPEPVPARSTPPPASAPSDPRAVPNWQGQIVGRLQRAKQYPEAAREEGAQGTALVSFVLDRGGHVLSVSLVRSAGTAALDTEAVALIRRAAPLPPPPEAVPGNTVTLTVPISFALR